MKKMFLAILLASQPCSVLSADVDQPIICRKSKVEVMQDYQLLIGPVEFTPVSESGTVLGKIAVNGSGDPLITIAQKESNKELDLQALEKTFGKVKKQREVFRNYSIRTGKGDFVILQIFVRGNELLKYRILKGDTASNWRETRAGE